MSARAVNDAVEQFHVFSLRCDDANALYAAFSAYRTVVLETLTLRRVSSGETLEADILLINKSLGLEQAGATNNTYRLYLPEMSLKRSASSQIEVPKLQDGVATYAVYAGTTGRSGVAVHKDVKRQNGVTRFWEPVSATEYKQSPVGNMYKPSPSGTPPYNAILSAPIMMTLEASAAPTEEPTTACIGVLNITHTLPVVFTAEDCAWAQTCASLIGSLHGSFFVRFAALAPETWRSVAQSHPNEAILERSRIGPSTPIDRSSRPAPSTYVEPGDVMKDVTKEELEHERITPWVVLREDQYLITAERLGGTELDRIRSHITQFGIACVRLAGHAPESEIIEALAKCIGPVAVDQNEVPGKVKSIRPVHEKPANTGDSALALGAHVDGTQHDRTPAVLIFQYVHGAGYGALSQFWDAARVFLEFEKEQRQRLMSALAAADAGRMSKNGREYNGPLLTKVTPSSVGFRFRIDEVLEVKDGLKEDFEKLKARFEQRGLEYTPLKGDIAIFDNRRLLHGRDRVGGDEQREHRRMWIEEVHSDLRHKIHLGIRPVAASIMAEIEAVAGLGGGGNSPPHSK